MNAPHLYVVCRRLEAGRQVWRCRHRGVLPISDDANAMRLVDNVSLNPAVSRNFTSHCEQGGTLPGLVIVVRKR